MIGAEETSRYRHDHNKAGTKNAMKQNSRGNTKEEYDTDGITYSSELSFFNWLQQQTKDSTANHWNKMVENKSGLNKVQETLDVR